MYIKIRGKGGCSASRWWRRHTAGALLLFLAAILTGCGEEEPPSDGGERIFAVQAAEAREVTQAVRLELSGEVKSGRQVAIIPSVPGRVAAVPVKEGQAVSRGELLLRLENTTQQLQLRQAQAALDALNAELARVQTLIQAGALPEKTLRDMKTQILQAELARDLAKYAYDLTVLKSPLDGVVTAVKAAEGELVGTTMVMAVLSREGVTVQAVADEGQLQYLSPGMAVQVRVPAVSAAPIPGSLFSVSQTAIPGSRSFTVEVVLSGASGELRPGMYALVLVEETGWRGFQVPSSALLEQDGLSFLFIIREGRAVKLPVETGMRRAGLVEIGRGLEEGERFITRVPAGLKDGSLVEEK